MREDLTSFMIVQVLILVVEAVLLILLIYFLNKWYLANIAKSSSPIKVAVGTAGIYLIITLGLIIYTTYSNFK